jgi:tripartite-type tricarboxylate transporter receptor subunit TctC
MDSIDRSRRRVLAGLGGAAVASAASVSMPAFAQKKFPDHTITLIVPFAPGGNIDIVGRSLAPGLSAALGQSVVVDNRAGGGGAIGANAVARAEPDGHTLLVTTPNALVVLPLMAKQGYSLASFDAVGQAAATPLVIVVQGAGRFKTIQQLLDEVKAKPGTINAGHSGPGTTNHVAELQLMDASKIAFNPVAYRGSAPALVDLMGGQLDFVVDQLSSSTSYIQSGQLRVLAVMSAKRDPGLPDVPTLREAGLKDFEATTASGLVAPAGTPASTIAILNAAMQKTLGDPDTQKKLAAIGSPASPSTSAEWKALLDREAARAQALEKAGRFKVE